MSHSPMEDCNARRRDGRLPEDLRSIDIKTGELRQPSGSASISVGSTRVLVAVYGPKPLERRQGFSSTGIISCDFKTVKSASKETSRIVKSVLEATLHLNTFPNACLEVQGVVLQSDGAELGTLINATSTAVAHAGIEMIDMVTSCHLVGINGVFIVDPTEDEQQKADFEMILAAHPSTEQVCHFSMNGTIEDAQMTRAIGCCLRGCARIKEIMRSAWI